MAKPPEPFPGFENRVAMPEVADRTVGEVGQSGLGLCLTCRDCGRSAWFTPLGIRTQLHRYRETPVAVFVRACRCQTCGGDNAIASGQALEAKHLGRPYIVYRERHGMMRQD